MRLIDADAVYKILESCEIKKATIENPLTDWEYGYTCGIERAESEIECAPIIDAIPVIRCKDCRWYKTNYAWDGKEHRICAIEPYEPIRKADDFCSRAERKENE